MLLRSLSVIALLSILCIPVLTNTPANSSNPPTQVDIDKAACKELQRQYLDDYLAQFGTLQGSDPDKYVFYEDTGCDNESGIQG